MPSTMSLRRQRAASSAIAFLETREDEIGSCAEEQLGPLVRPGEKLPDVRFCLKLVRRWMAKGLAGVVAADQANINERDGDLGPRLELVEATEDVQRQLVAGRRIAVVVYGAARAQEILALDGITGNVKQPLKVLRQGQDTVKRLREAAIAAPQEEVGGVDFDPVAFADRLEPAVERLARAYDAVVLERRKVQVTVDGKAHAHAVFDTLFRAGVRFAVALCLIGGKPELAARLSAKELNAPRRGDASDPDSSSTSPANDAPSPPDADSGTEETNGV